MPFRIASSDLVEVLLLRRHDRTFWGVPKGQLMPDCALWEAAATEAFEEAGVRGTIDPAPVGSFLHRKTRPGLLDQSQIVEVALFPLAVEVEAQRWPEMDKRERRWFSQAEAAMRVEPGQLRDILEAFSPTRHYMPGFELAQS